MKPGSGPSNCTVHSWSATCARGSSRLKAIAPCPTLLSGSATRPVPVLIELLSPFTKIGGGAPDDRQVVDEGVGPWIVGIVARIRGASIFFGSMTLPSLVVRIGNE